MPSQLSIYPRSHDALLATPEVLGPLSYMASRSNCGIPLRIGSLGCNLIVLCKERGSLRVSRRGLLAFPEVFVASPSGNSHHNSRDEQDSHDGEGEDPLESNDSVEELSDANGGREHTERETHGVVLVDGNKEPAVHQERPHEDVPKDPSDEAVGGMHHDGSVPVDGNKGPRQRSRHHRPVNETGICVVAEVERRQVEEVEEQNELGPDEVGAHEQHDKGKVKQVVEDEVASHAAGLVDIFGVA